MALKSAAGGIGALGSSQIAANKIIRPGYVSTESTLITPPEAGVITRPIATLAPFCDDRKRTLGGTGNFMFQTIKKIALGGAVADFPMLIPMPDARFIMVSNCDQGHYSDSLWMHFVPGGKSYGGNNAISAATGFNGSEPFFPFCQQPSALTKVGIYYEFDDPLPPTIFFDIGQEAGGSDYFITFLLARSRAVIPGSVFANVA